MASRSMPLPTLQIRHSSFSTPLQFEAFADCNLWYLYKLTKPGVSIPSSRFFIDPQNKYKCLIKLYPNGWHQSCHEYIGAKIELTNAASLSQQDMAYLKGLDFSLSILDVSDGVYLSQVKKMTHNYYVLFRDLCLRDLMRKDLKKLVKGAESLESRMFTMKIGINLTEALGAKVYRMNKYTDFQLIVGDTKFKVHRSVLAARSPVFEAMFDTNGQEAAATVSHVQDIEPTVMGKLLKFMYVDKLEASEDSLDQLLIAASRYEIADLMYACEKRIVETLSIDNIYDVLKLADRYSASNLEKAAIEFYTNNFNQLKAAKDFQIAFKSLSSNVRNSIFFKVAK